MTKRNSSQNFFFIFCNFASDQPTEIMGCDHILFLNKKGGTKLYHMFHNITQRKFLAEFVYFLFLFLTYFHT